MFKLFTAPPGTPFAGATVGGCACGKKFSDKLEHAHLYNGTATSESQSDVDLNINSANANVKQIDPIELLQNFNKSGGEILRLRKEKEQARVENAVAECKRQKLMSSSSSQLLECEVIHN